MADIYDFLETHGIAYELFEHPAVYTCEEAMRLLPEMPGADTKNLFLREKKGERHILVVVGYDKSVDLKALAETLGTTKLSLASAERLKKHLGIEPGAVSLLAVVNDTSAAVEVVLDEAVWSKELLRCHPLVNTQTLVLSRDNLQKILELTAHKFKVLKVPERQYLTE